MGSNVCKLNDNEDCAVEFDRSSFAAGEYRKAFKGMRGDAQVVVKAYKARWRGESELRSDVKMHKLASELADEFSRKPFVGVRKVEGLVPDVATVAHAGCCAGLRIGEEVTVEPFISGQYEKFVSNNGTYADSVGLLTTFCHWTYHRSNGKFLLCDVQGVKRQDCYVITDPAFHTHDRRFGDLDLGDLGMQVFFKLHVCTDACRSWRKPPLTNLNWKDCERVMRARVSLAKVAPAAGSSAHRYQ